MIVKSLTELIGKTPMLELSRFGEISGAKTKIIAKLELFEPLGSVKDRAALYMIEAAEKSGELKKGGTIIESTSGNTGIGLAFIAAARGYKMILTMPESMSIERRKLAAQLGAEVVLTPASEGMTGAIKKAVELCSSIKGAFLARQFDNPANAEAHRQTTAPEIIADMDNFKYENKDVDFFVAGVGTGGTITGVGEVLKKRYKNIKIIAVEPDISPVLSGGKASPHKIQGIGAGFVPGVLNTSVYDSVITVSAEDSFAAARLIAKTEGVLVGISSGAALAAALKLSLDSANIGKNIVVLLPDTGERYLSTALFE